MRHTLNRDNQRVFRCKNGRKFSLLLTRAADNDSNVLLMFTDNLIRTHPLFYEQTMGVVMKDIKLGNFTKALTNAFSPAKANEPPGFWRSIHQQLKSYESAIEVKQ